MAKISFVEEKIRTKQDNVRTSKTIPNSNELSVGQFVFVSVRKDSESPGLPSSDEARIYFKDNDNQVYKFIGSKV
tara:strand:- start:491 stop:715 length:225 start_codon:yes stop_codon:yes gene_type:complete